MTAKLCFVVGVVMLSCAAHAEPGPSTEAAGMVALSSFAKVAVAGEIPALSGTKAAEPPSIGESPTTRELQTDLSKPSGDPPGQPATAMLTISTMSSAATGKAAEPPSMGASHTTQEWQTDLSKPSADPAGQPATSSSITSNTKFDTETPDCELELFEREDTVQGGVGHDADVDGNDQNTEVSDLKTSFTEVSVTGSKNRGNVGKGEYCAKNSACSSGGCTLDHKCT